MKEQASILPLFLCALFCCATAMAQIAPGTPNFSAFDSHEVDSVDLLNNNVILTAPVMSKNGAFPFSFGLVGNYYVTTIGSGWFTASNLIGTQLQGVANGYVGIISGPVGTWSTSQSVPCPGSGSTTKYSNWVVNGGDGTSHSLAGC